MNLKTVTIADLEPHPDNPNTHPAKQIDALAKSLTEFTQVKNVVIWNNRIIAGHGVIEAAKKAGLLTLEAQDISHWDEAKATAFMLADIRLPNMAIVDEGAMAETLRAIEQPLDIPGFDENFLAGLPGFEPEPPPESEPPPIDRAAELQEKWQCETGQIWQIESKANPGHYQRLICGDCRDMATVEALTQGKPVNGIFTSPPYAMQRAKQYGGTPADEYVEWWEAVQANARAVLAEDGSFFVNIKPHCKDGQRVLYVFDLVLAMVRRWGWRFVDELCWTHQGMPGDYKGRFKNCFEPIFHFTNSSKHKHFPEAVLIPYSEKSGKMKTYSEADHISTLTGSPFKGAGPGIGFTRYEKNGALPGNTIEVFKGSSATQQGTFQAATFPLKLPTFFIRAYSDPLDTWLDPFAGSGTVGVAAENEGRTGLMIEKLPKYCAVILERFQTHTQITPELINA
jgi:site-specific DNA-methyltransferase (adenine-specific)/site-specific DNA-methyltransferase (cytosine-N4-specific)